MDDALQALYRAIRTTLSAATESWGPSGSGSRCYADLAPAGAPPPYVVFFVLAGGEINASVRQDAEFVLLVKCIVEEDMPTALAIAARLSALLNDQDAGALAAGDDWTIINISQEQRVHYVEQVDGRLLHHSGHRFRVRMESL
ncbi:MAG: hypothetical protein L6Q98_08440 [Anaerolineae bacterium]|nr:hypothetical protein [Anaerolineae bacterium]NUQ02617.1 hypothetical protein [Anaerolineae bacterium]